MHLFSPSHSEGSQSCENEFSALKKDIHQIHQICIMFAGEKKERGEAMAAAIEKTKSSSKQLQLQLQQLALHQQQLVQQIQLQQRQYLLVQGLGLQQRLAAGKFWSYLAAGKFWSFFFISLFIARGATFIYLGRVSSEDE